MAFGVACFIFNKNKFIGYIFLKKNRLLLLSVCMYFPLAIFLAVSPNSHSWYIAPVIPFVGIISLYAIFELWQKHKMVQVAFIGLLLFTLARRFVELYSTKPRPKVIVENKALISNADRVFMIGGIEYEVLLYNYFFNRKLVFDSSAGNYEQGDLIFSENKESGLFKTKGFQEVYKDGIYTLLTKVDE